MNCQCSGTGKIAVCGYCQNYTLHSSCDDTWSIDCECQQFRRTIIAPDSNAPPIEAHISPWSGGGNSGYYVEWFQDNGPDHNALSARWYGSMQECIDKLNGEVPTLTPWQPNQVCHGQYTDHATQTGMYDG